MSYGPRFPTYTKPPITRLPVSVLPVGRWPLGGPRVFHEPWEPATRRIKPSWDLPTHHTLGPLPGGINRSSMVESGGVEPPLERCERPVLPLSLRPQSTRRAVYPTSRASVSPLGTRTPWTCPTPAGGWFDLVGIPGIEPESLGYQPSVENHPTICPRCRTPGAGSRRDRGT